MPANLHRSSLLLSALSILLPVLSSFAVAPVDGRPEPVRAAAGRQGPWTKEKAWAWYEAQPWIRGCNYMPASAANRVDQWQELGSAARFEEMEREVALMEKIGFNTARIILAEQGFAVWNEDPDGFMRRFERTLEIFGRHGVRAIVALGNDCSRPKRLWKLPKSGEQHWDLGYHGGLKQALADKYPEPGYTFTDVPELRERFYRLCEGLMAKYARDRRILLWNIWNEPGMNDRATNSVPVIRRLFEIGWKIDPDQPLSADVLDYYKTAPSNTSVAVSAALNDIVSYHSYEGLERQTALAKSLKEDFGRPMINTEWLARSLDCTVQDCYPFFAQNRIGCTCWGFVVGKYQTHEPWEYMWRSIDKKDGRDSWEDANISRWFHDLFRPSHHPYDPEEIEIIRRVNAEMDAEDEVKLKGEGEGSLRAKIAKAHRIVGEDIWYGYRRTKFDFNGRTAWIVEPSAFPAKGMPWTWTMQWAEAYVERTGVLDLLRRGYHHVTVDLFDTRMNERGLADAAAFQRFLVDDLGFAPKADLVGLSWGGFFSVRYAAAHPAAVRRIYLDAPLLNLGGRGDVSEARIGPWARRGLKDADFATSPEMPVNMADRIAAAKIPVLLVYGGADTVVPPKSNCEPFAARFEQAGGKLKTIGRDLYGHHPHGLDSAKTGPIVDFFWAP